MNVESSISLNPSKDNSLCFWKISRKNGQCNSLVMQSFGSLSIVLTSSNDRTRSSLLCSIDISKYLFTPDIFVKLNRYKVYVCTYITQSSPNIMYYYYNNSGSMKKMLLYY